MKKTLQILFIFLVAVGQGAMVWGQNLILNGDFELGPDSSSAGWILWADSTCTAIDTVYGPDFWTVVNPSPDRMVEGTIFTCAWDNDTAQSGRAYIVMAFNNEAGNSFLLSPLQKDSLYKLSYYTSLETFNGSFTQPHRIEFKFNNGGNSIVSPYSLFPSQWLYHDTIFVSSANSTEIEIMSIEPVGSGTKIDNISLIKISNTGINKWNLNPEIKIYPNPATDILNIKTNNKILVVEICDIYGKVLLRENKAPFELSDISTGIYIVKVKTDKKISTTKIFIQ